MNEDNFDPIPDEQIQDHLEQILLKHAKPKKKCDRKNCNGKSDEIFTSEVLGLNICKPCLMELMLEAKEMKR